MKKRILALILFSALLCGVFSIFGSAESGRSWYVKRNGNKQPLIDEEQKNIEKYNGYYIDKKHNDTAKEKRIYITFDAGYENGNVEKILNILKEKQVKAAFFILDHIVLKNTDLVVRMADEGHLVCNHTKNHKDLSCLTKEKIIDNVTDLEKIYEQKTGREMSKYFRFPEGKYSIDSLKVINELGYKSIFWSFGYDDWDNERQPNSERAKEKILNNTHNGEVILLHPTSIVNVEILPTLIDTWREWGYEFGTLDELVENCKAS